MHSFESKFSLSLKGFHHVKNEDLFKESTKSLSSTTGMFCKQSSSDCINALRTVKISEVSFLFSLRSWIEQVLTRTFMHLDVYGKHFETCDTGYELTFENSSGNFQKQIRI